MADSSYFSADFGHHVLQVKYFKGLVLQKQHNHADSFGFTNTK